MKSRRIEKLLIESRRETHNNIHFIDAVMERVAKIPSKKSPLQWPRVRLTYKQLALGAFAIAIVSVFSFSGYAYATGTDPLALIKRLITGDTVQIEYRNRQFEHGSSQNYSDAAISAYAELNTVEAIAFAAEHANAIPKNGVEYVGLTHGMKASHIYPTIGVIADVTDNSIVIEQKYLLGDKMNPSQDIANTITIDRADIRYYTESKIVEIDKTAVGNLIELRQNRSLKHVIKSGLTPQVVLQSYVFKLSHSLSDFKEADTATRQLDSIQKEATSGLIEKHFGGFSNRCLNNAGDICNNHSQKVRSLYGYNRSQDGWFSISNPNAVLFGEGLTDSDIQPTNLLLRAISGDITEITSDTIVIKNQSNSLWTVSLSEAQREKFKVFWKLNIKVGDKISGLVLQDITDLDSRNIVDKYVHSLNQIP